MKLKKNFSILLTLLGVVVSGLIYGTAKANSSNTPPSLEEVYTRIGYTSPDEAVKKFENHFNYVLKLPKIKPSISFTHQLGRFSEDTEYNLNESLEIKFINSEIVENHYKIVVRPLEKKLTFKSSANQKDYTLKNGKKAFYIEHPLFNFLIFEHDHWQYVLGIDKRVSKVTADTLVEIANSIE
ncbi:carbon monoxide dehydrogenase [Sporosarcina aquimarina]|uniref:carbon monoxide dehydrogenase n=1 Tax=Sporosarcina aquimarina TaxID=114975 RepID=UPI001C8E017B|nr:carbon monoxide dehydrogenase [Sporosarcina aquimarina]MBY0220893.1 carbon monoxide dehydrogenase [Sporosarcina aquimarina]